MFHRLLLLPLVCVALLALGVTTSTSPAVTPNESVKKWLDDLADVDPNVREQARERLMGLNRDELPALRGAVEKSRPLMPAQSAVLHDVVVHVYLAAETYETSGKQGFLGVMLQPFRAGSQLAPAGADDALPDGGQGVLVAACFPGFCGFRSLHEGDIIIGIRLPDLVRTLTNDQLQSAVCATLPGTTLSFELVRQGRMIRVPVKLDPRPRAAEVNVPGEMSNLIDRRGEQAEEYWRKTFGPLLEPGVS